MSAVCSTEVRFGRPAAAAHPATPETQAFAEGVLRLIVEHERAPTLVEIYAILTATVGSPAYLTPAGGDSLNAALDGLQRSVLLPDLAAARLRAIREFVFYHFPNSFTVYCD